MNNQSPLLLIKNSAFKKIPIILGEAPSPRRPTETWSKEAITTRKLAATILGCELPESLDELFSLYVFDNLISTYPGKIFPKEQAANHFKSLYDRGVFENRITFLMGNNVHSSLEKLVLGQTEIKIKFPYNPLTGCNHFLCFKSENMQPHFFIALPHPQIYYRFINHIELQALSNLLRASKDLPPISLKKRTLASY